MSNVIGPIVSDDHIPVPWHGSRRGFFRADGDWPAGSTLTLCYKPLSPSTLSPVPCGEHTTFSAENDAGEFTADLDGLVLVPSGMDGTSTVHCKIVGLESG